ncbi:MAG: T9SS type A sorting domain-containing protein [Bacteroidetes bacterium]|nr:T9SS type A sorting domain-containing protein [Bacteroidota bacterium]
MKFISQILMTCLFSIAIAQHKETIWIGGDNGAISFNGDSAISFFRTENSKFSRTSASICDQEGSLLFYSNGFNVFNRNFALMENGDSLSIGEYIEFNYGLMPTPDGAVIVPMPGDSNRYYLFYMDLNWIFTQLGYFLFPTHLFYSVIDLSLDGGNGAIVDGLKDISILNDTLTQAGMQVIRHGNGRDWWLVCHEYGNNNYYKFLIDDLGIHGPDSQLAGIRYWLVNAGVSSSMRFNSGGDLFIHQSRDSNIVELHDFDRCTGLFSNYRTFKVNDPWVPLRGVSVSPQGTYLYISSNYTEILQFNLDAIDIYQSRTVVGLDDGILNPFPAKYFLHRLGPDGRIYISSYDENFSLHVINNPDIGGIGCNFEQRGFPLVNGTTWRGGVPNIPNFSLGALSGSSCDTITSIPEMESVFTYGVYPNPCFNSAQLSISGATEKAEIFLYNTFGQLLYKTTAFPSNNFIHTQLPVRDLVAGIYLVKVSMGEKEIAQKLVKR